VGPAGDLETIGDPDGRSSATGTSRSALSLRARVGLAIGAAIFITGALVQILATLCVGLLGFLVGGSAEILVHSGGLDLRTFGPCSIAALVIDAGILVAVAFEDVPGQIKRETALRVIDAIASYGCAKLTFAGGEPTLCPFLGDLIEHTAARDLTTCVISNGERLRGIIESHAAALDWVGLSVDSCDEARSQQLGRGTGDHIRRSIELAALARQHGIRIKLNTVVTALNQDEDMSALVRRIQPERWKVFQVLAVAGQNDGVEPLLITAEQFRRYLERHAHLAAEALAPIAEDNAAMTGSYLMIDSLGRFFDNVESRLVYGVPILEAGVERALRACVRHRLAMAVTVIRPSCARGAHHSGRGAA
jgi:radical S-adenosyl methionine domain-containing protein 2